jgi:hypothetical protein
MATENVSGQISVYETFTELLTTAISPESLSENYNNLQPYPNGTGPGQVDQIYAQPLTLAGAPTTLNLGSLPDLIGTNAAPARIREAMAWIPASDTNSTHTVTISPGASNGYTPIGTTILYTGGSLVRLLSDPKSTGAGVGAVTSSSSNTIKLDPGSNTVTVCLILAGCSTA